MSRDHISINKIFSSAGVDVYRVFEAEVDQTDEGPSIAVLVHNLESLDITIVPCGIWSGNVVITSVKYLFEGAGVVDGKMPSPPYGGKRMLYLLATSLDILKRRLM